MCGAGISKPVDDYGPSLPAKATLGRLVPETGFQQAIRDTEQAMTELDSRGNPVKDATYWLQHPEEAALYDEYEDQKEHFSTGAQRDTREGKGRYDLISPIMLRRLAILLEWGAAKYGDKNWEKGMPIDRFLDSAMRHINQFREGLRDEDHLTHAIFNLMAVVHLGEKKDEA